MALSRTFTSRTFTAVRIVALAWVVVALGCTGSMQGEEAPTGTLSLQLQIADDVAIDSVNWEITGGNMDRMFDTIDTSADGATASVEVFGLPPTAEGELYTITMTAIPGDGDDGASCEGSEDFPITAGAVTDIMVFLNCKIPSNLGAVRVNGKFNICAELTKAVVSPLRTSIGNDITLSAQAEDAEGDPIQFLWEGVGGTIANPAAADTTYTCDTVGSGSVTVTVSDDAFEVCDHSWTVSVECVQDGGGTGGTGGGTGGTGGSGGAGGGIVTPDACSGGLCEVADVKLECEAAVLACIADEDLDLSDAECEALSTTLFCSQGTGGTGGTAGTGGMGGTAGTGGMGGTAGMGGMAGTGGTSGGILGCNQALCATDQERRDECEEFLPRCVLVCEDFLSCGEDECFAYALLFICNEQ